MQLFKIKPFLLVISGLLFMGTITAQTITVKGTVRDEKGQFLSGSSVIVPGTSQGTTTDEKGNFSLSTNSNSQLMISLVGYDTIRIAAQPTVNVILTRIETTLTDVVVIGYGSVRKRELTGSIATVGSKDFQKGSITTPEQLISGKIAGVSVTPNGGGPGSGGVIRIRQGASLNASNDPLLVIDGVPLSGNGIDGASSTLSTINPNDIETFTVLKDAAATAIYGSRASNGVILITTKKGTRGKPTFNFNTQVSLAQLAKKMDVQSAGQFRAYVDSLGGGTYDNVHTYKSLLGNASTDWQDEIYTNAISTDNNLSVSGSIKNLPYRVSVGYLNQNGILDGDNLQRVTAGISLNPRFLNNHLKVDINLKGSQSNADFANGAAISAAAYFDPTQPVHATSDYGNYFEWSASGTLNKLAPRNPVALLDLYSNKSDVQRSFGNIQFDYSLPFLPELHANLNLGYDVAKGSGKIDVPAFAAQNFLDGGQKNKYGNKQNNKVSEFYFSYNKGLKSIKSNINAVAGYGYYNNATTRYVYPTLKANGDTIAVPTYPFEYHENTILSFYGRAIYTFNQRYILAASYRTDAGSKFSKANRWTKTPSVAFTWRINKEPFMTGSKTFSTMNLRLSAGKTANQDGIKDYPYQAVYSQSGNESQVQFGDQFYNMGSPAAYDANIKWEETETYNGGIDYGFLSDRITGSIDVYFKKTKDLLNESPIPAGSNFSSVLLTNIGNIENKGVEFLINADVIRGKKINWAVSFNAAYNENKVKNLTATKNPLYAGTPVSIYQINSIGYPIRSYYTYKQEYLDGRPVEGVYADLNGDGLITPEDQYHYKSPYPKFILGFSTQFSYDKWTLSTVLRAKTDNYVYNAIYTGSERANVLNPLGYLANSTNDIYKTGFINGQGQTISDYYIENGSFLKMDNLGLSYTFGRILRNKANLQVNANCQNVFTVTKYKGIDPEIENGIDNTIYPRPRTFVLGVNLQF
jgi:TonB-dependent starch-binding outer membrane protein SusC